MQASGQNDLVEAVEWDMLSGYGYSLKVKQKCFPDELNSQGIFQDFMPKARTHTHTHTRTHTHTHTHTQRLALKYSRD